MHCRDFCAAAAGCAWDADPLPTLPHVCIGDLEHHDIRFTSNIMRDHQVISPLLIVYCVIMDRVITPALWPSEHMKAQIRFNLPTPSQVGEVLYRHSLFDNFHYRAVPISTSTKALEGDVGLLPALSALATNVGIVLTSATFIPVCCNIIEDVFQASYLVQIHLFSLICKCYQYGRKFEITSFSICQSGSNGSETFVEYTSLVLASWPMCAFVQVHYQMGNSSLRRDSVASISWRCCKIGSKHLHVPLSPNMSGIFFSEFILASGLNHFDWTSYQ